MGKLNLITDLTKLGEAIKATSKAHAKVDAQWQLVAVSAIAAFANNNCGNVFYINAVYKALGKGARHKAMTEFFLAFGGVKANEGENKDMTPFIKDAAKQADVSGAEGTNWFDMAASPKPDQVIDYLSLAMKLVKRAPKDGQTVEHPELRSAIAKTIAGYAADHDLDEIDVPGLLHEAAEADELAGVADAE